MTDQHLITPPRELVRQWIAEIWHEGTPVQVAQSDLHLAARSARWGYEQRGEVNEAKLQQARDEELEACCGWLSTKSITDSLCNYSLQFIADNLRNARRPKPPSLKEQALGLLNEGPASDLLDHEVAVIRRALEAIPDE